MKSAFFSDGANYSHGENLTKEVPVNHVGFVTPSTIAVTSCNSPRLSLTVGTYSIKTDIHCMLVFFFIEREYMKSASICIRRDDGDLALVATFNNNDEHLSQDAFNKLLAVVAQHYIDVVDSDVLILDRQDSVDYISLNEGEIK